jgi:hypothetical protein
MVTRVEPPRNATENAALFTGLLALAVVNVIGSFLVRSRVPGKPGFLGALVLCESAALFGVVAHFVTGMPRYWMMLLIGLTGMLLHYPRRES